MTTQLSSFRLTILSAAAVMMFGAGCPTTKSEVPASAPQAAPSSAPSAATPGAPAPNVPTPAPAPKPTAVTPKSTAPAMKTVTVLIQNSAFSPQVIAVNAGDTVTWVNKDSISHTTVSEGALIWDSGNLAMGQKYSRVFKYTGSYNYRCGIHPSMTGTVVVR